MNYNIYKIKESYEKEEWSLGVSRQYNKLGLTTRNFLIKYVRILQPIKDEEKTSLMLNLLLVNPRSFRLSISWSVDRLLGLLVGMSVIIS